MRQHTALLTLLFLSLACVAQLGALEPGNQAPALSDVTWVKGEPVKIGEHITVVEFWATWCGPCRETIPHLTKLQKRYHGQVQIVGLSDEALPTVKPFVDKMGEQMDYHIGIADTATRSKYMEGIDGIPHAFIIDAKGTVLWSGFPQQMSSALADAVAGTFDAEKYKRLSALQVQLQEALDGQHQDIEKALVLTGQILAIDPVNDQAIDIRIEIAAFQKKPEAVRELLLHIPLAQLTADQANSLAWSRAVDERLPQRNLDLALAFIHRALELEPANASYIDTMARLQYDLGDVSGAIASISHAIEIDTEHNPEYSVTLGYFKDVLALRSHPAQGAGAASSAPPP